MPMKNYDKKLLALMLAACCLYGGFRLYHVVQAKHGVVPTIQAPETVASLSVKATPDVLMEGVTASDAEDGDLTSRIFVESLSPMDENFQRTVTYGVFDSDDHVSRTSRKIQYTDYKAPQFTIKQPLMYEYVDSIQVLQNSVGAESVLDGDISGRVMVESAEENGDSYKTTFSVTDSAGQQSKIVLNVNELLNKPNFQIELNQYLLRVAPGTVINPKDYIKSINMMGMDYNDLIESVEIRTDYNAQTPGTYEFIYYLERPNGDFGTTKLVVIVE